ncbi:MAG: ATP-dependent RNA helicase HrpA [Phycisphaerales bacterium]
MRGRFAKAMIADRAAFERRWRSLQRRRSRGEPIDRGAARLEHELAKSIDRAAGRERDRPRPNWDLDLPVVERRDEIAAAIRDHQVVVVCGETGSGKTTQLPKICLELGRGVRGMIGHTQPRRVAARTVSARIAEELGVALGREVGFKVRFGDQTSDRTFVKLMTDGMLLAETQHDRRLLQYDTLIIDEAHERSLNIDFLLGYVKKLLPRRPDLKLIITSATIDPQQFSAHFNDAPIVEVSGRTYPVETRYRPLADADRDDPDDDDLNGGIVRAVEELSREGPGDILVFLPGEREIRLAATALRRRAEPGLEILPLYARLSTAEQQKVFKPHSGRRVVLATNVAETSLTVPGIRYVIDSGLARISRYSARSRVQRLPVEAISQASAEQRKGRCGRLGPGVCIRLFSEADFAKREAFTPPEIVRTNLASVILQMESLELGHIDDFPFLDPPRRAAVREGYDTLHELGAMDDRRRLTAIGRDLARWPIDPRLARILLASSDEHCLREGLILAAALTVQDPRDRPADKRDAADEAHARFHDERSDFVAWIKLWEFVHEHKVELSGSRYRKMLKANFLSYMRVREWIDVRRQLKAMAAERKLSLNTEPAEYDALHRAILAGFITNIGRRDDAHEFEGVGGRRFYIFPGSGLFRKPPKWVVAAELVETTKLYARAVAQVQPEWIERVGAALVTRSHSNERWDPNSGRVLADEKVSLGGLEIVARRTVHFGPIDPERSRTMFIHHGLVEGDMRCAAPFMKHNRALVDEIERLEAKARRRDLLASFEERYQFFDSRLPDSVYSLATFEKWRRTAERADSRLLFMAREDLLRGEEVSPDLFPDAIQTGQVVLPVDYQLEPGSAHDGVTVTVPLEAVGQLTPERLAWLVPGMLPEKIEALIRSLPKQLRTSFLPAREFAQRAAAALPPVGDDSLLDQLASTLKRLNGVTVPRDAWRPEAIPEHLRLRVRVVDSKGKTLASGRDLAEVRRTLGPRLHDGMKDAAPREYQRSNLTDWDLDALPEREDFSRAGIRLVGFPTLIDRGSSVELRMLDSEHAARQSYHFGLRRLLTLQTRDEIVYQIDHLPRLNELKLLFSILGDAKELRGELVDLVAERAFFPESEDGWSIRDREGFQTRLNEGWSRIGDAAIEMSRLAHQILSLFQQVDRRVEGLPGPSAQFAIDDIDEQLGLLMMERFMSRTPFPWLQQYPRYLTAIVRRLEKLEGGRLERDRELTATIRTHFVRMRAELERRLSEQSVSAEFDRYRWMVEEYRVSLFAQDLGTVTPVSEPRLEKQWRAALRQP